MLQEVKKIKEVLINAEDCENGEQTLKIVKDGENYIIKYNEAHFLTNINDEPLLFNNINKLFNICEEDLIYDEYDYFKQKLTEFIFYYISNYIYSDHLLFDNIDYYLKF